MEQEGTRDIREPAPETDHLSPAPSRPIYMPEDDTICWVCGGPVIQLHCKIVCKNCGFMRDCSDP
ncbi:MAG: hypothetical protein C4309_00135 [Chloroflexota bacterium]